MDDELLKKIFDYNITWLFDRQDSVNGNIIDIYEKWLSNPGDSIIGRIKEDINTKFKSDKANSGFLKGALIQNNFAMNVKYSLKRELIESKGAFNKTFFEDIIKISENCIITDIFRFQSCQPDQFYRPSISFITTKDNARKLKYLESQDKVFSYLTIDYDKVKYSEKPSEYRLGSDRLQNNNILDKKNKVNQHLLKFRKSKDFYKEVIVNDESGGLEFLEIPTHIGRREFKLDVKDKIPRYDDIVKNEIKIHTDYYYKTEIFEFFKTQVRKKLQSEINLGDWSFCTVFSPLWCSVDYVNKNPIQNLTFMNKLIDRFNMIYEVPRLGDIYSNNINVDTDKYNTDLKMLFFISECFGSPPVIIKNCIR